MLYIVAPAIWEDYVIKGVHDKFVGAHGILQSDMMHNFGIFPSEDSAHKYASKMSAINGGIELSVYLPTHQYYAKPSPSVCKSWKNGELVPK